MSIGKPFYRTIRPYVDGYYGDNVNLMFRSLDYIKDKRFSEDGKKYISAFLLLERDIHAMFESVMPTDKNKETYSYRLFELILRTCTQVESNFRAILRDNQYTIKDEKDWNMNDYSKIEKSHFLSEYTVEMPFWYGELATRQPYKNWGDKLGVLDWYQKYNGIKHNMGKNISDSTLDILCEAYCGLAVLISSQFYTDDFSLVTYLVRTTTTDNGFTLGIGGNLLIKFPNVPEDSRYDFIWYYLEKEENPFQKFNYN
jgi:hypothetical protein